MPDIGASMVVKTPNTANLLKVTEPSAGQTIKTTTYSSITGLVIGPVNPNQQVGLLLSFAKGITGTCQFQAIGVTSGTVYWTSPTLDNTSAGVLLAVFTMTGSVAENIQIQAKSSETSDGVSIYGQGTSAASASALMCGDVILTSSSYITNSDGSPNYTQPVIISPASFEASLIEFASYYDREGTEGSSINFHTLFEGIGVQPIDVATETIQTITFPTNILFNRLSVIPIPLGNNTGLIYGLFAISFTGFWIGY
jgi:hypothetical protein